MASRKNHKKTLAKKRVHRGGWGTKKRDLKKKIFGGGEDDDNNNNNNNNNNNDNDNDIIKKMQDLIIKEQIKQNNDKENFFLGLINNNKESSRFDIYYALFIFELQLNLIKKYINNETKIEENNNIINDYLKLKMIEIPNTKQDLNDLIRLNEVKIEKIIELFASLPDELPSISPNDKYMSILQFKINIYDNNNGIYTDTTVFTSIQKFLKLVNVDMYNKYIIDDSYKNKKYSTTDVLENATITKTNIDNNKTKIIVKLGDNNSNFEFENEDDFNIIFKIINIIKIPKKIITSNIPLPEHIGPRDFEFFHRSKIIRNEEGLMTPKAK